MPAGTLTLGLLSHSLRSENLGVGALAVAHIDRKSTRLNSSHVAISYAVFCLKKKKQCRNMAKATITTKKQELTTLIILQHFILLSPDFLMSYFLVFF